MADPEARKGTPEDDAQSLAPSETVEPVQTLTVSTDVPATPDRAIAAIRMLARAVEAALGYPPGDALTVVVTNREMGTTAKAWTAPVARALEEVDACTVNPVEVSDRLPPARARRLVAAIREGIEAMGAAQLRVGTRDVRPHRLGANLVPALKGIEERKDPQGVVRGRTHAYSRVLRVGRSADYARDTVRIHLYGGAPVEIPVAADVLPDFVRAFEHRRPVRIELTLAWTDDSDGKRIVDKKHSCATGIDETWVGPLQPGEWKRVAGILSTSRLEEILAAMEEES